MPLQLPYVPVLQNSCCCSLRTGSLCLGWLALVSSACKFILIILIILNTEQHFLEDHEKQHMTGTIDVHSSFMAGINAGVQWLHSNPKLCTISMSVGGVLCFLETVFIIMLLDGIHNGKPSQMQPYLLCGIFALVSTLLGNLMIGIFWAAISLPMGLNFISIAFLTTLIFLYLWSILYSHYRELEERKNGNFKYEMFSNENKIAL